MSVAVHVFSSTLEAVNAGLGDVIDAFRRGSGRPSVLRESHPRSPTQVVFCRERRSHSPAATFDSHSLELAGSICYN